MGWNGSGNWNADGGATRRPAKKSSGGAARGLVAGLAVVAGAAVCWLLLTGREEPQPERPDKGERGLIGEVTPAAAPTNRVEVAKPEDDDPNGMPTKIGETKNGYMKLPSGRLHRVYGVITNSSARTPQAYAIFRHPSENAIAGLLSIQPGQGLVGTPLYTEAFVRDFLESLKEPITVSPEDSEHDRELKQAVIDAKAELKAAHERGEDITKILLEERKNLQRMAQYKKELQAMTLKNMQEAATAEEMDDCIQAANRMLEDRGIAPLNPGLLGRIKLKMQEQKE